MPSDLKPCPWCNGPAETRNSRWYGTDHWGVACTGCGNPWFDYRAITEAEAIAAWNQRPEPATPAGDDALVPRDVAESWRAKADNYQNEIQSALSDISDMMNTIVDNWPVPSKLSMAVALVNKTLASMVSFDELARREAAAYAAGEAKGRADERAEVVKWIRGHWASGLGISPAVLEWADAIERGHHERPKP